MPNFELVNAEINFKPLTENLSVRKIIIYPDILNIHNYENFNSKKVILKDSYIKFQISNLSFLTKQLFHKEKKLFFDNLNLEMNDKKTPVIALNDIKFTNYGYYQNSIRGKVFGKNFKVEINDDYKNINLKLLNSGIYFDVNFEENEKENLKIGIFKSKILNSSFKSNFEYDGKVIRIYNSFFRNKNLSFNNKSEIILKPFLDINSVFTIEKFNPKLLSKVDLNKLLSFKEFLKKINNKSEINFETKKFNRKIFDDLNLKINIAYGRMNYSKKLLLSNSKIQCNGSINFLEEYPLLFFDCFLESENKKEFLKQFSVRIKNKNEILKLKFAGNLNFLNRKINFKNISMNDNYKASKEDLKYFNSSFENILLIKVFLKFLI